MSFDQSESLKNFSDTVLNSVHKLNFFLLYLKNNFIITSALIVFFASILSLSCSKDKTRPVKSTQSYSSINENLDGHKGQTSQYAQTLAALENERQEIKDLRNSLQELKGTLGQNPDDLSLEEVEMISLVDSASELDEESMVKSAQSDIVEQLISSELNDPSSNITSSEALRPEAMESKVKTHPKKQRIPK